MAQRLNSDFNYRTQVIGETPWAKLQTLHGFLDGRKRARALEKIGEMKLQAKKLEVEHLMATGGLAHVILNLKAEIMEYESAMPTAHAAYRLNELEIESLEGLIAELYIICEPTRIPGYTDEQMYEANAANEFTMGICKDIHAEILANGRPSPAKLRNAMSNPVTWNSLKTAGLIPADTPIVAYLGGFNETLQLGYAETVSGVLLQEAITEPPTGEAK